MTATEMNALLASAPATDARYFAWVPTTEAARNELTALLPQYSVLDTPRTGLIIAIEDGDVTRFATVADALAHEYDARVHGIFDRETAEWLLDCVDSEYDALVACCGEVKA